MAREFLFGLRRRAGRVRRLQPVLRPDTTLRGYRDLLNRRHAARSRPKHPGRLQTVVSVRRLMLRLARENGTGLSAYPR